ICSSESSSSKTICCIVACHSLNSSGNASSSIRACHSFSSIEVVCNDVESKSWNKTSHSVASSSIVTVCAGNSHAFINTSISCSSILVANCCASCSLLAIFNQI